MRHATFLCFNYNRMAIFIGHMTMVINFTIQLKSDVKGNESFSPQNINYFYIIQQNTQLF